MSFTPDYVCTNPNCKSFGRAHPNCRCSAPGEYALGGAVHFCASNQMHNSSCEHFADGGEMESNQEFASNPDLAIDNAVAHNGLLHTISRTGYTKSEEPGRAHSEFLDSHRRGRKSLQSYSNAMLEPKGLNHEHDPERAIALESKLGELNSSPDKALEIGGNLGDSLPMHHAMLAAKTAAAMTYLQSIKPMPSQSGPLDPVIPPSKADQRAYQRQIAIAEDPKLIFQHVNDGTAIPQDFQTLGTLYPKLQKSIQDKAFETLANAKAHGKELTQKQKKRLGVLVGQAVTFQQTPQAIAAIMHANAPAQMPQPAQKAPKKASGVELKQINKVDALSQTPLQRLQAGRNK